MAFRLNLSSPRSKPCTMKSKQLAAPVRTPEAKQETNPATSRDTLSPTSDRGHPWLGLHPMFGNRKIGRVLQAKLEVSEPGDAYERQADAVAELVMRMPEGEATASRMVRRRFSGNAVTAKRKTKLCDQAIVRSGAGSHLPRSRQTSMRCAATASRWRLGTSLRAAVRVRLRRCRVHTSGGALETARQVRAQAFTVGQDVVFGAGQYSPKADPENSCWRTS